MFRIDLSERKGFTKTCDRVFYANPNVPIAGIGRDGLPIQGRLYRKDDVYYSCYHRDTGTFSTHKFKSSEPAYCGSVRVVFDDEIREGKTVNNNFISVGTLNFLGHLAACKEFKIGKIFEVS